MWSMMFILLVGTGAQAAPDPAANSCVRCHQDLGGELQEPVTLGARDIHFRNGLYCESCHGGDPKAESAEDSMSPRRGFVGRPKRGTLARLCASCHGNSEFMRRYTPQPRVDQYTEYLTSVHGRKYIAGDPKVAVCTDCHGYHGIRAANDATSPVYPTNVAATCGRCHSDPERMRPYDIPVDQVKLYSSSVHGVALLKNRDLAAPACNSCHGNHGAAPPGIDSVANVCGQCHALQWDLFKKSPHAKAFADYDFKACVTCHEHHGIIRPTDAMLGVDPSSNCTMCHQEESAGYAAAASMKAGIVRLQENLDSARILLEKAERAGMEVSKPLYDLNEGRNRLILARVEIHRFDPAAVRKVLDDGEKIAASCRRSAAKALDELTYRRKGFAVSAAIILVMIGLLLVKIRRLSAGRG